MASGKVGGEPLAGYVQLQNSVSGDHHPEGIFVIRGEGIKAGVMTKEMQLLDVAPTLQGLLGIAPAQDLKGESRFGAPGGGPASRDAMVDEFVWLNDEEDRIYREHFALTMLGGFSWAPIIYSNLAKIPSTCHRN